MKHFIAFTVATVVLLGASVNGVTQAQEGQKSTAPMQMEPTDMKSNMGMNQDLGPADANYDLRFLNAMTEHHNAALTMAKDAEAKSKRPEIQRLAREIIKDQQKEITLMETYRRQWYKK